jgi:carbon monoxide dehydrogenase subunit G
MELEHSFSVPVPEDRAWDVLLDVERVAHCMPGATLQSIDGDEIHGSIRVKVGPINMVYQGTARFTERDPAAHVITLEASGKETRGAGTASAKVRSMLEAAGDRTHVVVHTTLNVTGKPAQFGRGVMAEVGGKLIGIFADNLAAMLAAESVAGEPAGDQEDSAGNEAAGTGGTADEALPIDVLNLGTRAWSNLRRDGIQTLGDLTRRTSQQLLAIEHIGPASVADIRSKLADRGLALADSPGREAAEAGSAATPHADTAAAPTGAAGRRATPEADGDRSAAGKHAADGDVAPVTELRPAQRAAAQRESAPSGPAHREPPAWQPQDEAIDLLEVAGMPVLKRALPAALGAIAVAVVVLRARRRRARSR